MIECNAGWLSPTGEFFKMPYYQAHEEKAYEILNKLNVEYDKRIFGDGDCLVENLGWVKISLGLYGDKSWHFTWGRTLTSEQRLFLRQYEEDRFPIDFNTQMRLEQEDGNII